MIVFEWIVSCMFCYHYHYSSKSDSCLIVHPYVQRINDQLNPHASFCQFVKSVCTAKNLALVIESAHNYHMIYIRISLVVQCLVVGRRWKLKQTCAFDRTLRRLLIQTPAFSLPSLASFSKSPYVEIQNPDSCFDTKHNKTTITTKLNCMFNKRCAVSCLKYTKICSNLKIALHHWKTGGNLKIIFLKWQISVGHSKT